ncbi:transport and Golgi organization protein 11-like isoform X1 [Argopecten irradians]|uniref:transport and Golgi organization protein 11-like isoform X1 n=1 Tax=Argopecten irradians TaxID=31199 RepID=UPI0037218B9F
MNGQPETEEGSPSKSHVTSLPSDYSDVQPSTYDPEFISEISNKMQVPHKLGPKEEVHDPFTLQSSTMNDINPGAHHMTVPDRIFLAGEGQHIGAKENLRLFDIGDLPPPQTMPFVGMMTPPRTLTLEEQGFPAMDIKDHEEPQQESTGKTVQQSHNFNGGSKAAFPIINIHDTNINSLTVLGGEGDKFRQITGIMERFIPSAMTSWFRSAVQLEPYTPGASMNESLLLNEEDETTLLKTQVAKLTRKVTLLEEDNIRRSNYEKIVYPIVFGWSIWKIVSVFWSLMRPRHYY